MTDHQVKVVAQASAIVDDFDAALTVAVQQITALRIAEPTVTIQPIAAHPVFDTTASGKYRIVVSGVVPAVAPVEVQP